MKEPYEKYFQTIRIVTIKRQEKMNAVKITLQQPESFNLQPGQYVEISSPDDSNNAIALAAMLTKDNPHTFKVCVVAPAAVVSEKQKFKWKLFQEIQEGAPVKVRGPLGRPLPMPSIQDRPLLLIAAGSGLASMRSIFSRAIQHKHTQVLYSAKTINDLPFFKKIMKFKEDPKNIITLTQEESKGFHHGRLNKPLQRMPIDECASAFICGSELFMREMVVILLNKKLSPANIYVILNKIVPKKEYLCPVFRLDELDENEFSKPQADLRNAI